ncbi:M15 family metallopeptidase [Noviherbaspirillum cavernae]|nr:M15 family metallopeptidase [Noviherbaspirillum cavernae]
MLSSSQKARIRLQRYVKFMVMPLQVLSPSRLHAVLATVSDFLRRRKIATLITSTLLVFPFLLTMAFLGESRLEGFDDTPRASDPVITTLLHGEQLVPPPPLPPEYFVSREVEAHRQELGSASREWLKLDADFRQRLLTAYELMVRRGYQMTLLEGYRSPERQALLAKLGAHVTNAGAYQSYHQYGLAADSAFLRDGKIIISEKDPWAMEAYRQFGECAELAGLVWGGRWRMMDLGHVELRKSNILGRR